MKLCLRGVQSEVVYNRIDPLDGVSTAYIRNGDGEDMVTPSIISNIFTTSLVAGIGAREYIINVGGTSGFSIGETLAIISDDGKHFISVLAGKGGSTLELKTPAPFDIDTGYVISAEDRLRFTIPASSNDAVAYITIEYASSGVFSDMVLLGTQKIYPPVSDEDIYNRWARLRGQTPNSSGGSGFTDQVNDAIETLRLEFWSLGFILDNIKSSSMLKELILAKVGLILLNMGYDPMGGGDLYDLRRDLAQQVEVEKKRLLGSPTLWIDKDNNGVQTLAETGRIGTLRWEND